MKKIIMVLLLAVVVIAGCKQQENPKEPAAEMTRQLCADANGYWNECGSPCAGTDAEICIQMCEVQCQCGGIAGFGCPEGYKCRLSGKIADEMGVCIKE